jgi:DNA-directed RNA polymerase subunit beta'
MLPEEILNIKKSLLEVENLKSSFDYFQINIASPQKIKSWANRVLPNGQILGQVLNAETINYTTNLPQNYGLFCEKIFGPIKDYKCSCGKYKGFLLNKICEKCFVELTESRVRRYRMGYVELFFPVAHSWYLRGTSSYLSTILSCINSNINISKIEQILYFKENITIDINNPFYKFYNSELNNTNELKNIIKTNLVYRKNSGAEIIKSALETLNLPYEITKLRSLLDFVSLNNIKKDTILKTNLIKKIRILESFISTKTNPSWMILTVLPILPPGLRPFMKLDNNTLAISSINEIYKLIIIRNQNLFKLLKSGETSELIYNQACRSLQLSVDFLIDKNSSNEIRLELNNKSLKSLTENLEGKQGKFRQYLLGKRVDYSGRSVIVVGPSLKLNQCGLPYKIAIELFKPFLVNKLINIKHNNINIDVKLAYSIIENNKPFIWKLLEELSMRYSILLNRAPTLHKFGIQAFNPIITLSNAIYLHPLVCSGFNADFDGDQMAVHLPLYESSQYEVQTMMRPSYNILSTSNGKLILAPSQEMVFGSYYLTLMIGNKSFVNKKYFNNENDALDLFYSKKIYIHTPILINYNINNLNFYIKNNLLYFINNKHFNKVKILKKYLFYNKYYFITNIGIIISHKINKNIFKSNNLFLETTPGRLIFNKNLNNSIKS